MSSNFKKGELIAEGKTKKIWKIKNSKTLVIIENKEDITAFDDPDYTKKFKTKAEYATTTTCRVFELLQKAGIPVAYKEQISPTKFVAPACKMIPLEVVARRFAVGSYLKRNPHFKKESSDQPYCFHRLETEFFLKTTGGKLVIDNKTIVSGLRHTIEGKKKTLDDPFIINPYDKEWKLFHPKKPRWEPEADLQKTVKADDVLGVIKTGDLMLILRQVFLVLEKAWALLGCIPIDLKIEFGITSSGELLIADVIDNDSWRLRDDKWEELSKQAFRDGENLNEVEKKYGTVANFSERFYIPSQALIIWKGSDDDSFSGPSAEYLSGTQVCVLNIVISGHKKTRLALDKLNELTAKYPGGGCIIVKVGKSNGLGPILAAHTLWPVIVVPANLKNFPADIWSSIRMPSHVPLLTVENDKLALEAAYNILAAKNPVLYMKRQIEVEQLDY